MVSRHRGSLRSVACRVPAGPCGCWPSRTRIAAMAALYSLQGPSRMRRSVIRGPDPLQGSVDALLQVEPDVKPKLRSRPRNVRDVARRWPTRRFPVDLHLAVD